MKIPAFIFIWLLLVFTCFLFAGVMAFYNKEGWGWFLGAGVLLSSGLSYNDKKKKEEEK